MPLVGERLRNVLARLQREVLDVEVEVAFRRRVYAGSRSGTRRTSRLVGVRDADTGRPHPYNMTNIPAERLAAEEVAPVYACRWQIELLFKEMKSYYRLEDLPSRKPHIVEALLYATLVTLVVSRRLLGGGVRQALSGRPRVVPEGRWAVIGGLDHDPRPDAGPGAPRSCLGPVDRDDAPARSARSELVPTTAPGARPASIRLSH